ncbi:MAG: hypothetical protein KDD62_10135, partial [Bdellovibrionales bacterium]|nr:hypothetical protein [Bdellovibrionales bacterium]
MSLFSLYSGNFSTLDASDLCFSEHHPYEQGFAAHYDQALKPFVELYEAKRLRALSQARARLQWGIPLAVVIALIALYIATAWSPQFGGFLGIAAMGGLGTWIYSSLNSYKADLKSNVFPKILSFFENASYRATCNDRMTSYAESKIVPAFDRENSEDELILTYKGVH